MSFLCPRVATPLRLAAGAPSRHITTCRRRFTGTPPASARPFSSTPRRKAIKTVEQAKSRARSGVSPLPPHFYCWQRLIRYMTSPSPLGQP